MNSTVCISDFLLAAKGASCKDNYLFFSGNLKSIKKKIMENEIVGHAYLVDCNGLIRWKAHANPAELEINHMLDCSQLLLKEAKRTLNSEDKVPWNSR